MLLILMYHRVGVDAGRRCNTLPVFQQHLDWLRKSQCDVVLPGEILAPGRLSVCLTFDDACVDFRVNVFPLLQQYGMRAVVAVPTRFIQEQTVLSLEERLSVPPKEIMNGDWHKTKAPFCTWQELREMVRSGLVDVASHSASHKDLRQADAESEAEQSRKTLEKALGRSIPTFVYPYGKVDGKSQQAVRRHYPYGMRIGAASNSGWFPHGQPLCRISADQVEDLSALLSPGKMMAYKAKQMINQARATLGIYSVNEKQS